MMDDFARRIQSQGLSMEQYFQFTGTTAATMAEQMKPEALKRIQNSLVLEAIAKTENIEVSEERLDEELAKMAKMYRMEAAKLKEMMSDRDKEQIKNDIAIQEAVKMITDAAKMCIRDSSDLIRISYLVCSLFYFIFFFLMFISVSRTIFFASEAFSFSRASTPSSGYGI